MGMAGLGDLFKNKLFLQMLAAGGADLAGGTGGKNLLGAINTNLASQNYIKILQKMLGGEIPEGGKITHDETGTKITIPKQQQPQQGGQNWGTARDQFTSPFGPDFNTLPSVNQPTAQQTGGTPSRLASALSILNPFASDLSGISASDLAGLSPEMITQALNLRMGQEEINQKKLSELANMMYQQGLLDYYQRQGDIAERQAAIEEQGIPIRGFEAETDRINAARQLMDSLSKDDRTELIKNFEYAKGQGFGGTIEDFRRDAADPSSIREYEYAVKQGYKGSYIDFLTSRAPKGVTVNIGDKVQEKLALGYIESRLQLYNPEDREKAISSEFKKMGISDQIIASMQGDSPEARELRTKNTKDAMRRLIVAGRGKIIKEAPSKDGASMVWLVEWTNMDGTTSQEVLTHVIK